MLPYIGITDFMNVRQVRYMQRVFQARKSIHSNRLLHVGVMMSYKTLHGIPTKWQKAFPTNDQIAEILSVPDTYNCLHYADYEKDPDLWKSLVQAISYGGAGMNAIQLDMIWPDPIAVAYAASTSKKEIEVILQIGKNALELEGNDPQCVVKRLARYAGAVNRVLLDKSMGQGAHMNAYELIPFARAIRDQLPELGITVAGGLGPETMHLVEPLVNEFSDLSIDAQGRLRPSGNALDPIDWSLAEQYLTNALSLFVS